MGIISSSAIIEEAGDGVGLGLRTVDGYGSSSEPTSLSSRFGLPSGGPPSPYLFYTSSLEGS